jgi:hypothetical protein
MPVMQAFKEGTASYFDQRDSGGMGIWGHQTPFKYWRFSANGPFARRTFDANVLLSRRKRPRGKPEAKSRGSAALLL